VIALCSTVPQHKCFLVAHSPSLAVVERSPSSGSQNVHDEQINELYVFGNSLSDTGNVFKTPFVVYPPSPPLGESKILVLFVENVCIVHYS
jgi:hypothetical protein